MNDTISELYDVILSRKHEPAENSYTRYLFEQGIDKILKKVGEESSEVIISAKNGRNDETVGEISDLIYHLLVLMAQQGITPEELFAVLDGRAKKTGNLKTFHKSDKDS
jgi:phosphoribosyl-ATP pyrophosphohydrolase